MNYPSMNWPALAAVANMPSVKKSASSLKSVPMQIRLIKHVRKVYGYRDCESAPAKADKPAQVIEKSMASPSVLAMLLTTKYVDGLSLRKSDGAPRYHRGLVTASVGA